MVLECVRMVYRRAIGAAPGAAPKERAKPSRVGKCQDFQQGLREHTQQRKAALRVSGGASRARFRWSPIWNPLGEAKGTTDAAADCCPAFLVLDQTVLPAPIGRSSLQSESTFSKGHVAALGDHTERSKVVGLRGLPQPIGRSSLRSEGTVSEGDVAALRVRNERFFTCV